MRTPYPFVFALAKRGEARAATEHRDTRRGAKRGEARSKRVGGIAETF